MKIGKLNAINLLLDGNRGQYMPRDFLKEFKLKDFGLKVKDYKHCKNPNSEYYWEAWDRLLVNARHIEDGNEFTLYQDGDLWLICVNMMTPEEKEAFGFDEGEV